MLNSFLTGIELFNMKKIAALCFWGFGFLMACDQEIGTPGSTVTEQRPTANFGTVFFGGNFNVFIEPDTVYSVKITGDEKVLPHIQTLVYDGRLTIKYDEFKENFEHETVAVYLKGPFVYSIDQGGSGSITSTLTTVTHANISGGGKIDMLVAGDPIKITVNGSGNAYLRGTSDYIEAVIYGSGSVYASGLQTKRAKVVIAGSGSCELNISDFLQAIINGSGNISYSGNPVVTQNINGSGKLIKK